MSNGNVNQSLQQELETRLVENVQYIERTNAANHIETFNIIRPV
jgi:hypothetical protein